MSRRSPIEQAVQRWVSLALGVETIFADQDLAAADRSLTTYATVRISTDVGLGTIHEEQTDDPGDGDPSLHKLERSQTRQGVARITVYGEGAAVLVRSLEFAHKRANVRDQLNADGLTIGNRQSVTDVTARQSTSYQRRSQIDVAIRWTAFDVEEYDTIDSFDLTTTATEEAS